MTEPTTRVTAGADTHRDEHVVGTLPVRSARGELVKQVASPHGSFLAVAFEPAAGRPLDRERLDAPKVRSWGQALARLHLASESFPAERARVRRSREDDVESARSLLASESTPLRGAFEESAARLGPLPVGPADFGLIHFDFAAENIFWDGARCRAIDFDSAARCWYAADLAFAMEPDTPPEIVDWFVEGYRRERRLDAEWVEALPALAFGASSSWPDCSAPTDRRAPPSIRRGSWG